MAAAWGGRRKEGWLMGSAVESEDSILSLQISLA